MPQLQPPSSDVAGSFRAAMAEFVAEGRGAPDDETMVGWEIRTFGAAWADPAAFAAFVRVLHEQAAEEDALRPAHLVPCTTWWWVDGQEYVGRIALRHRLNENLLEVGGHIGYDVRPSARRRGHATAMLAAVLPYAAAMGIDPALLTCDVDNVASRLVIEHAGGALEDERQGKLRYWVPTHTHG
jgi:predicted acetyltransferase